MRKLLILTLMSMFLAAMACNKGSQSQGNTASSPEASAAAAPSEAASPAEASPAASPGGAMASPAASPAAS
jgi:hypothetical protein